MQDWSNKICKIFLKEEEKREARDVKEQQKKSYELFPLLNCGFPKYGQKGQTDCSHKNFYVAIWFNVLIVVVTVACFVCLLLRMQIWTGFLPSSRLHCFIISYKDAEG